MSDPRYLLDTNTVSHMIRFPQGSVVRRAQEQGLSAPSVSVMTAAELRFGARKRGSPRLDALVEGALASLRILPFEASATETYADIRHRLATTGNMIGPVDLFIAAHALSLGLTMVTDNVREFRRVEDLAVENWLEERT